MPTIHQIDWPDKLLILANGVKDGEYSPAKLCRQLWPDVFVDRHQQDIVRSVIQGWFGLLQEAAVKGCTGSGKGCAVAWALNLWFELSKTAKVIVTSVTWERAVNVAFAEVIKWRRAMCVPHNSEISTTQIKVSEEKWMRVVNPATGEGFSGVHGENVIMWFDEASGTKSDFWELAKTQAKMRVATANPRVISGYFYDLFPEAFRDQNKTIPLPSGAKRRLVTVDARDCYNVRTKTHKVPGQITWEQYQEIMANPNPMWGECFGHGCFPKEDLELQLIGRSWLARHFRAHRKLQGQIDVLAMALDVADSEHGDETILAAGGHEGVAGLHRRRKKGTMATVGWTLKVAQQVHGIDLTIGDVPIVVDADGVGAGVASRLEEQGCWVIHHHGSDQPEDKRNHKNMRAETWCLLAVRLDPKGPYAASPWALPKNERLAMDLCAQERRLGSDPFQVSLMPKDRPHGEDDATKTVRHKLGGRSPDRGDAVAMLWRGVRLIAAEDAAATIPDKDFMSVDGREIDELEKERREERQGRKKKKRKTSPIDRELEEMLEYYEGVAGGAHGRARFGADD